MFTFSSPWIFTLLLLPLFVRYLLRSATETHSGALIIPFFKRLETLVTAPGKHSPTLSLRRYLLYLIWLLLVTAATGPQWLGDPIELPRSGRNIILAADISGSMQIPDMELHSKPVDRLTIVKWVANQFIAKRKGDQLGLILFGSRAYLQTPLTFDLQTVQTMLNDATIGLAGPQTAMGDAIGLAIKQLTQVSEKNRVLILLTDGASNAGVLKPQEAAKLAAKNKIKIYTIGLGAEKMLVPGLLGTHAINPSADLDEATLQKISKMTHGFHFRATDIYSLQKVYKKINSLEPTSSKNDVFRLADEYYYWPLAIAFLLSIFIALSHCNLRFNTEEKKI